MRPSLTTEGHISSIRTPKPVEVFLETTASEHDNAWALAIFLITGAAYAAMAARDLVVGDTAEFLTTAMTFGVAHPSGYPLLTLLGHAFTWLPIGTLPFRANLVAVAASAGAVAFVFLTARQLGATVLAAAIAALALAFQPLFWEWSLALEAFPLNNLLAAAAVFFLVRWEAAPDRSRDLILATLCGALGLSNHLTIVCLAPVAVIVFWRRRTSIRTRVGLLSALAAVAVFGLLPYAYLPWAASHHPYLNWSGVTSPAGLLAHFLRSDYGSFNLAAPGNPTGSAVQRLAALMTSFTWLEIPLVLVGAVVAYRHVRWYFWSALLFFALAGPGFAAIANVDPAQPTVLWVLRRFFLLPHVALAPLAGLGVAPLSHFAQYVTRRRHFGPALVAAGALTLLITSAVRTGPALDQHRNHLARTFAEDVLASLEPRSVLLASGEGVVFPLAYLQAVEHQRPDVTVVALGLLRRFEWYLPELRRRDASLRVPFERYDPREPTAGLSALVEANAGRPFAFVGEPLDDGSLGGSWFLRRGLVSRIEPGQRDVRPDAIIAENVRLLHIYRVPDSATIKQRSAESTILARYARVAATIGDQYRLTYRKTDAAEWYRRALAIDPHLTDARAALARQ